MRVIVGDNGRGLESIANLTLRPALEKAGHELACVPDGGAAWDKLRSAAPPELAILPCGGTSLSGLELCHRVRAKETPRRPHLLLVAESDDPKRVAEALAAGADDCLPDSFHPQELLGRAMAALRILKHQEWLVQEIARRDLLLREHHILPAAAEPAKPAPTPASAETAGKSAPVAPAAHVPGTPSLQQVLSALFPLVELEAIVAETLTNMGLGEAAPVHDPAAVEAFAPDIGIVHFIILPQKQAWLDLLIETNRASAVALYQAFAGSTDTDIPEADLVDVMGETLNMVHGTLKARFKAKGVDTLIPVVPQSIPPARAQVHLTAQTLHSRHLYRLPGIDLRFTLLAHFRPLQRKSLKQIRLANVLAEPLRPAEDSDLVLINKGTLLNSRSLKKVAELADYAPSNQTHAVFEPSPLTALIPDK